MALKTNIKEKKEVELKYLTKEDLQFFKEILTAETIGTKEYIIVPILLEKLTKLGFESKVDSLGNIYAVRGEAEAYPMLNAHMDIVNYSGYGSSLYSFGSSRFGSSYSGYSNYDLVAENYGHESWFYEEIFDVIVSIQELCDYSEDYYKTKFKEIKSYLPDIAESDLYNMNCDCTMCKNKCLSTFVCDKFEVDESDERNVINFMDALKDYCASAYEEFSSAIEADEEESYEEEYADDDLLKDVKENYEVIVDLIADKIKGVGKTRVLGGDDKCGIFIALKVAELLPNMPLKILFTVQEESGCIGISHFIRNNVEFLNDVRYSLTIDRRDNDNLLWSQLGTRSCTDEFAGRLAREGVKAGVPVRLMDGSIADVIHIRDHVPNAVNMSAGYYDAHTSMEYIVPSDVDRIVGWVRNILLNV